MSVSEEEKLFICVICPQGCHIRARFSEEEIVSLEGEGCRRAWEYVRQEQADPRRTLTTTVRVRGGVLPLLPVRSAEPLPKKALPLVLAKLRRLEVEAPVKKGQVIFQEGEVKIIACRNIADR
ncbi:MAG: DUF1667 domain-containing protein [Anaerolineae bacterium]